MSKAKSDLGRSEIGLRFLEGVSSIIVQQCLRKVAPFLREVTDGRFYEEP
jgi:hypothetical protein